MGIEFKINPESGVVFAVGRGKVTTKDFYEYRTRVMAHPDFKENLSNLADLREANLAWTTEEAMNFASDFSGKRIFGRVAAIADGSNFALVRMILGWAGDEGFANVFRDMKSAREWLGLPSEDDS